jgi:hypothetical protein
MQTTQQETIHTDTGTEKYLVFQIGSESYGMPLLQVQEIRSYTPATRVPGAPPYVLGVINLRGNIIAVLDARTRFGIEPVPEGKIPSSSWRRSRAKPSDCASTRSPMWSMWTSGRFNPHPQSPPKRHNDSSVGWCR